MKYLVRGYIAKANRTFHNKGLRTFIRDSVAYVLRHLYYRNTVYLYEHPMIERDEKKYLPRIDNYFVHIVYSNQQADELEAQGFEFRSFHVRAGKNLNKGAIAFCIFNEHKKIMHIGWLAMDQKAKKAIDPIPYRVDFRNQACTSGTLTAPEFRNMGLMAYGYWLRLNYLKEHGIKASRNSIETDNAASIKVHSRFEPRVYAKLFLLKILGIRFRKEVPVTGVESP